MADYGTYWVGTTSNGTSSSGGWGSAGSYRYTQQYVDDAPVKPRSDAKQLNEGWDADQNPA